jgi:hypothetical protein
VTAVPDEQFAAKMPSLKPPSSRNGREPILDVPPRLRRKRAPRCAARR